jgi:glycosyltransferase involved in cell wall biosynthesis
MTGWLLVAGDFSPFGGMDRANLALARHLADRGPVHLVTHRAWDDLAAHPNVIVHRVPRPLGRHLLGGPFLARAGRRWAERLTRRGFRVVVNGGNCRWLDVNWVHYVHAAFPPRSSGSRVRRAAARLRHALSSADERAALRSARVAVCNSRRTARDVTDLLGLPAARVRVVYLGVDPGQFGPVAADERAEARRRLGWDERPWAAFVGMLGDARKGFDTLYAAWRELCRDPRWDANLAVVGRGAELSRWEARAEADGLADRVQFLGFRTDVPAILAGCDLMVHPARYESYGLGVHEALCRGLPVVVSAAAGVSERYPPELGPLVLPDPEDARALADRLQGWRRELEAWPGRVAGLAAALRAYTWDDMAADFVKAVESSPPTPGGGG